MVIMAETISEQIGECLTLTLDVFSKFFADNGRPPCKQELALALLMSDFPDVAHVHFTDGDFVISAPVSDYHDMSIFGHDSPLNTDLARLMGVSDENYRISFVGSEGDGDNEAK